MDNEKTSAKKKYSNIMHVYTRKKYFRSLYTLQKYFKCIRDFLIHKLLFLSKKIAFYESLNDSAVSAPTLITQPFLRKPKSFAQQFTQCQEKEGRAKVAGHIAYAILTSGKQSLRFI